MTDIKPQIRAMVAEIAGTELTSDVNLLGSGVLDSLKTMSLVGELEDAFDISLDVEDFTHFNFDSVDAIADLVKSKEN